MKLTIKNFGEFDLNLSFDNSDQVNYDNHFFS